MGDPNSVRPTRGPLRPVLLALFAWALSPSTALTAPGAPGSANAPEAAAPSATATTAPAADPAVRTRRWPLRELGVAAPIELRGIDQSVQLPLSVRLDETVVRARLKLRHSFSPGLIAELSQLKVFVNDELMGTVQAGKGRLGTPQDAEIELDPSVFTEYAKLRLQFIGHYATECEQPLHSSLWAQVSPQSVLELTTRRLPLRNDLALLPAPFFDPRDNGRLTLPFVLAEQPGAEVIRSAGVLASWFGALSSYRGARFPVSSQLPEGREAGHAVVLATNSVRPAGLALPQVQVPTLQVIAHPRDANVKLLLVLGRDAAQLQQAAEALALGQAALSGDTAQVERVQQPPRLAAHMAPNIVPTGGLVKLGSLVPSLDALQATGSVLQPIRVPLRLPADAYAWRGEGVSVDLRYRYTPPAQAGAARLTVLVNNQLVEAFPLRPAGGAGASTMRQLLPFLDVGGTYDRQALTVPAVQLGIHNELQFRFEIPPGDGARCRDTAPISQASIDGESSVDLRHVEHHAVLPDLALFATAGFPFTKYADLAETAVVLSDAPGAAEIETALTVLGRFGATTGVAGTRLQVVGAGQVKQAGDRDLLVIATGEAPAPLRDWAQTLPARLDAGQRSNGPLTRLNDAGAEWFGGAVPRQYPTEGWSDVRSRGPLGALMGFESPLGRGRSVVALQATDVAALATLREALLEPGRIERMRGDLVLVRGEAIDTFRIGDTYDVGELRWWRWIWYQLRNHPLWLVFGIGLVALLVALPVYRALGERAARRVAGGS